MEEEEEEDDEEDENAVCSCYCQEMTKARNSTRSRKKLAVSDWVSETPQSAGSAEQQLIVYMFVQLLLQTLFPLSCTHIAKK